MGIRGLIKSFGINMDKTCDVAMTGAEAVKSVEAALRLGIEYKIIFTDIMGDQPTEETQFVVDEVKP